MRFCAGCEKSYPDDVQVCPVHGQSLVTEVELSDTVATRKSMAVGASGGGGGVAETLPPVVRSNPTPAGSLPPGTPSGQLRTSGSGPAPNDSIVGTSLSGRYEVTRKIGEGGMGVVYEARHMLIGKRVAIKVLLDKYAQKADIVARLQQEARLASSIGHEHIVDITDFGETVDGRTFVVMEYLEGESLAQLIAREGALPPARTVTIARQVASALGAAHGKGVVHRDVKPENVFMIRRNDRDFVKVVDFGISKALRPTDDDGAVGASSSPRLTHTGMVLGTPLYMSPEQARGEDDLDHRIDVYAVGVIMYEMLTGEVPFRGTNYLSVISQVLSQDPKRPSQVRPDLHLSAALESVVVKAMAKDRGQRYVSMAELNADLGRLEKGDEVVQALSSPALSQHRRAGRGPLRIALWVGGVALLLAATVAAVLPLTRTEEKPAAAVVPPVQPVVTPDAAPALPVEPEKIDMVTIKIASVPAGAEVFHGAVLKGTTPCEVDFPLGKGQITLTLSKEGFYDAEVPLFPTEDTNLGVMKLKKLPKGVKNKPKLDAGVTEAQPDKPKEIPPNPFEDKKP